MINKIPFVFMVRIMLIFPLVFNSICVFSQGQPNWTWWCQNVNCTGTDHWIDYITISPEYMGPNALPVPEVAKGRVSNDLSLEVGLQAHFSDGDNTQNLFSQFNYSFAKDIVSLKVYAMPREWFQVSDAKRDGRKLSGEWYEPDGSGKGDIYFGFEMQIIKDRKFPDIMLRAFTKTTSGSNTGGARFTDSPGYFFDLSLGKKILFGKDNSIRLYGMAGLYVWQTYDDDNPQNDAPLVGLGGDLSLGKFVLSNSLGGYFGWKNNGDDPVVYRLELLKKNEKLDYLVQFQSGLNDYPFNSFKFSVVYHLDLHAKREN